METPLQIGVTVAVLIVVVAALSADFIEDVFGPNRYHIPEQLWVVLSAVLVAVYKSKRRPRRDK